MRRNTEQLLATALSHQQAGRLAEAEAVYRQVLAREAGELRAFYQLGLIARQTGRWGVAIDFYKRALAAHPEAAPLLRELAVTLQDGRRFSEAAEVWRRMTELQPENAEAQAQLGALLILLGEVSQAIEPLQRAAALDPLSSGLQTNLGSALGICHRYDEAILAQRRAVELNPTVPELHHNLACTLRQVGLLHESTEQFSEAIRLRPSYRAAGSGLLLNCQYRQHDRAEVLAAHREWERRIAGQIALSTSHSNDPTPGRRLRIGYVSPDFRVHSVGYFIEPLMAAHHSDAVEVFCYSGVNQPDAATARMKASAGAWRDVRGMKDHELAEMIQRDRIDILIDLAGHAGGDRLMAFAAKPAPIQVSYLGYPDTTGLTAIDYRMTDRWADPPGDGDGFHVEKLIRLSRSAWCYRPPDDAPAVAPSPCVERGHVTFGSFNILPKLSPEILERWVQILKRAAGARLLLKTAGLANSSARERLRAFFGERGIEASRVELRGHTASLADHLSACGCIDIALDSFPYHGTTTTCDALWMGVPVITLAGDRHVARVGVSLLSAVGHDELIARSPEQYVELAVALAGDRNRLVELRQNLRPGMRVSALADGGSLAGEIESAYRVMWDEWCGRHAG